MATMKLTNIAHRQRTYLLRDLLFATLVAALVVFVISAFTVSAAPVSADVEHNVQITRTGVDSLRGTSAGTPPAAPAAAASGTCAGAPIC